MLESDEYGEPTESRHGTSPLIGIQQEIADVMGLFPTEGMLPDERRRLAEIRRARIASVSDAAIAELSADNVNIGGELERRILNGRIIPLIPLFRIFDQYLAGQPRHIRRFERLVVPKLPRYGAAADPEELVAILARYGHERDMKGYLGEALSSRDDIDFLSQQAIERYQREKGSLYDIVVHVGAVRNIAEKIRVSRETERA